MKRCAASLLAVVLSAAGCGDATESGPDAAPVATLAVVTTIAGINSELAGYRDGPAAQALFDAPEGLALDAARQHLYIADTRNHVLRRLDLATNTVSTVAGVGTVPGFRDTTDPVAEPALLDFPRNLLLAPDGDGLFFTDTNNFVIRHLDFATGTVTTRWGTPGEPGADDGVGTAARFSSTGIFVFWAGGLVIDDAGTTMFVADSANQTIRRIDLTTDEVTTVAGEVGVIGSRDGAAAQATFHKPTGLALDAAGNLFIAEANSLTIRKLDLAAGQITTVAGKAPADPETFCENISPIQPPECDWIDAPLGTDARFRFLYGMSPDGAGGVYLVDSHNNLVRHFDLATTAVTTVAGVQKTILDDWTHPSSDTSATDPGTFYHPSHAILAGPGELFVADRSANCIRHATLMPQ